MNPFEWLCLFDPRNEDNEIDCYDEVFEPRHDECRCQHCESGNDRLEIEC